MRINYESRQRSWDEEWENVSIKEAVESVATDSMKPILLKYFSGKILEGGCGSGRNVIYYRSLGYDIEGVDSSKSAIINIKSYADMPVKVADLRDLPYPDKHFKTCYLGGVIEHCQEGAEELLREIFRVLNDNGLLIITVPFLNLKRCISDFFNGWGEGVFYQYMFTRNEIVHTLRKNKFEPIEVIPISLEWGLMDFSLFHSRLMKKAANILGRISLPFLNLLFGHTIAVVCRKR